MGEALRGVRAAVEEAGARRWAEVAAGLSPDGPLVVGARVLLRGIDPTLQCAHESGRAILHRLGPRRVFVPMDMEWAQRVGHMREVQTLLGLPREERWDAVATVAAQGADEVVVKLGPILVPGQLLLDDGARVSGLDEAIKALDLLQAHVAVPNTAAQPDVLLPLLYQILETHHWRAFRELYDQAATLSDKKVAFCQFAHAWEVASGHIAFEGYAEPIELVQRAPEGMIVRTRMARIGEKGELLVRPIRWVKRGAGWRLSGGLL